MTLYAIVIKYTVFGDSSFHYFYAKRYAYTSGQAISIVSSMFNSLSNWSDENGIKWFNIQAVYEAGAIN